MSNINITNERQHISQLVDDENAQSKPVTIINNKGKNEVLVSKKERKNNEETVYLSSIPGLLDNINNIRKTENWDKAEEFNPNVKW